MGIVFANGGGFDQRRLVCGQKRRHLQGRSLDATLFSSIGHLWACWSALREFGTVSGGPGSAFSGNFRFAILRMAAVLTTKSFFMVKSGAIRNGLLDRCLLMSADVLLNPPMPADVCRFRQFLPIIVPVLVNVPGCLLCGASPFSWWRWLSFSVLRAPSLYNGAD